MVEEPVEVDEAGNMGPDLHWDNGDIHYVYVCVKVSDRPLNKSSTMSSGVKAMRWIERRRRNHYLDGFRFRIRGFIRQPSSKVVIFLSTWLVMPTNSLPKSKGRENIGLTPSRGISMGRLRKSIEGGRWYLPRL